MHTDCKKCLIQQAEKMLVKHHVAKHLSQDIFARLNEFLQSKKNNGLLTPEAACFLHRMIKKAAKTIDLYKKEKEDYNNLMLGLEADIRNTVNQSANPFQTALRYALAGNVIDFGPSEPFNVFETLAAAASKAPAIDHSIFLYNDLKKAKTVLYLGDNAGEIVLDKVFISAIGHSNIWFATRGAPVINDITTKDAEKVGMSKVARIISNGYDAPSTVLEHSSPEFKKIFQEADVVISKGQGNLEGLMQNTQKEIYFLLMVKCNVIANMLNVPKGSFMVFSNFHSKEANGKKLKV